ncbi:DUF2975 domain-containing protein [Flavobacterium panacagri]|uniref:DUF2975 domain-containing protein n=1 Tax=Flavobacterium panacagri TaxID=3034146 RepID=UPI0025A5B47C|nr:DUF2975 domain-containing protein [Flavobacterium panacagri]
MKNNNKLVTVLYIISRLSFRVCQLSLLFALIFECIPDGNLGSYSPTVHHSRGYQIKTQIQLTIPDTTIIYKDKGMFGLTSKSKNSEFNGTFNGIKNDKKLEKNYQINNFEVYNFNNEDYKIKKEFYNIDPQASDNLNVIINPKNYFFKAILFAQTYLSLLLALFISYQLMRLFKQLRTNFAFDQLLNKRIRNIGYSFIAFQIITILISKIITQYLSTIRYYHYIPSIGNSEFHFMSLSTYVEYNWQMLFLGLCLIVLAKLLSYGYDLQNENELTI